MSHGCRAHVIFAGITQIHRLAREAARNTFGDTSRCRPFQLENEALCGQKLLQEPAEQAYILHHNLTSHPGLFQSAEMPASRSFAARAVGSSLIDLVLAQCLS